jgi:hypothetical protein
VALVGAVVLAGSACRAEGPEAGDSNWSWQGDVAAGQWIRVRNTNGTVRVEPGTAREVEVRATKRWKGRRPQEVSFVAERSGSDVTVCALWGSGDDCDSRERHGDGRAWWRRLFFPRNSVSVDFVVRVPAGVKVEASSVNGAVTIDGATSDVVAETVNGAIKARTLSGALTAETVNGAISATIDSLVSTGDISLETVNGAVALELPEQVDAVVEMSTVNGRLVTDYPITVTGKISPKELKATIGQGGRQIKLETVNGNATIRRKGAASE